MYHAKLMANIFSVSVENSKPVKKIKHETAHVAMTHNHATNHLFQDQERSNVLQCFHGPIKVVADKK